MFGLDAAEKIIPPNILRIIASAGIMLYACVGIIPLFLDANYLDYSVLGSTQVNGQHLGILLVELGVGMTVMAIMLIIFFAFAGRDRP